MASYGMGQVCSSLLENDYLWLYLGDGLEKNIESTDNKIILSLINEENPEQSLIDQGFYLKLKISEIETESTGSLKLINKENENLENFELIGEFSFVSGNTADLGFFVKPKTISGFFDAILLEYSGSSLSIDKSDILVCQHSLISDKIIKHIGVSGRPGLPMIINDEEIRIGPTGRFELKDYDIYSFDIVSDGNKNDSFVVDYQYVIE